MKKSAKGLLYIEDVGAESTKYVLYDERSWFDENRGELQEIFRDSVLLNQTTLMEIRNRVKN